MNKRDIKLDGKMQQKVRNVMNCLEEIGIGRIDKLSKFCKFLHAPFFLVPFHFWPGLTVRSAPDSSALLKLRSCRPNSCRQTVPWGR
jgi:hypothetical protein